MSRNKHKVHNDLFVSTSSTDVDDCDSSYGEGTERKWNIQDVYETELSLDELVRTLEVIDIFKRKYPNAEIIQDFEDIVRDEVCQLFGGSIKL